MATKILKMTKQKKAQLQVTFNWVYILIAGSVILLFFIGLAVKQKSVSEENLQQDLLKTMESILQGAGVSEKTKNFVETSGLSNYILEFKCEDGSSTFGIKGNTQADTKLQPIFAPKELQTTNLILWSLPYQLPYKITDLLMVSSLNTKYYVIGSSNSFWKELKKSVSREQGEKAEFNFEFIANLNRIKAGRNDQVRIIDLVGTYLIAGAPVPSDLAQRDNKKVTGVSLLGGVTYFQKSGKVWKKLNLQPIPIISLGNEKDAARYAAIFAADGKNYQCNMMKAFTRMKYINEIYQGKLKTLTEHYQKNPTLTGASGCSLTLGKLNTLTTQLAGTTTTCTTGGYTYCNGLASAAQKIKLPNNNLEDSTCIALY